MNADEFKNLKQKYEEGKSTLEEEYLLANHVKNSETSLKTWFTFVKNNQLETPADFNDQLWKSFQNKKKRKRIRFFKALSVAASIVFLISVFIISSEQKEQSYSEKEMLLNEALGMFDQIEQEESQYYVFYENEMIIVYTTSE